MSIGLGFLRSNIITKTVTDTTKKENTQEIALNSNSEKKLNLSRYLMQGLNFIPTLFSLNPKRYTSGIFKLPTVVFSKILSYLDLPNNTENLISTSKKLKQETIEASGITEAVSLRDFIGSIIQNLDKKTCSSQINSLKEISKKVNPLKCANLIEEKTYLLEVKKQLVDVMKTMHILKISKLEQKTKPSSFMKDIFKLTRNEKRKEIYKKLEIDESASTSFEIDVILENCINDVSVNMDEKTEYASIILDLSMRDSVLCALYKHILPLENNVDKSIAVARMITNPLKLVGALYEISEYLLQHSDINRSIEVAMMTPNLYERDNLLSYISTYVKRQAMSSAAIKVDLHRFVLSKNISKSLSKRGLHDQAYEQAKKSYNILVDISSDLNQMREFDKFAEVSEMMNEHLKDMNNLRKKISWSHTFKESYKNLQNRLDEGD